LDDSLTRDQEPEKVESSNLLQGAKVNLKFKIMFILGFIATSLVIVLIYLGIAQNTFPATSKLRVESNRIGKLTFYQSQFFHPMIGWTAFAASKYNGDIRHTSQWTNNKIDCENNIETYKQLKNL
jgi:hypothetical protein